MKIWGILLAMLIAPLAKAECYDHYKNYKRLLNEAKIAGEPGAAIAAGLVSIWCPPCVVAAIAAGAAACAVAVNLENQANDELARYNRCLQEADEEVKRQQQQKKTDKENEEAAERERLKNVLLEFRSFASRPSARFGGI